MEPDFGKNKKMKIIEYGDDKARSYDIKATIKALFRKIFKACENCLASEKK